MKILFVTTSTFLGGAEQNLLALISCLKEHEIKVISLYPLGEDFKSLNAVSLNMGYFPTARALVKLKKEIASFKPAVVHAQMFKAIQMCRLVKDKSFKLITAPHTNYKNKNFFSLLIDRALAYKDDISLAESDSTFNFLLSHQKYNKTKTFLLPNEANICFDADQNLRSAVRKELGAEGKTVFVCVARLAKGKGHKYLLQAFEDVYQTDKNTALWLAGDGEEKENLLKTQCPGVKFLGGQKDIKKYLNAADVFVLPSESESRSLALLEARAMHLPAVAANTGDNGAIYVHGKTGFIYNAKDSVVLACFLKEMCRTEVRNKFKEDMKNGTETIFNRYCDAYLGLVRQSFKETK